MADVPARTGLLIDGVWDERDGTLSVLDTWSGERLGELRGTGT